MVDPSQEGRAELRSRAELHSRADHLAGHRLAAVRRTLLAVAGRSQAEGRNRAGALRLADRKREAGLRTHLGVVGRSLRMDPAAAHIPLELRLAQGPAHKARPDRHFHRHLDSQNPPAQDASKLLHEAAGERDRLRLLVSSQVQ